MRKEFKLKNKMIGWIMAAFAVAAVVWSMVSPDTGMISLAGVGLLGFVDLEGMDEEQKKFVKGLDEKLEEINLKFLKDVLPKSEYVKELTSLADSFKKLSSSVISDKIDKKDFDKFKDDVLSELVKLKGAMERTPEGGMKIKSLENQLSEQLKDFVVQDGKGYRVNIEAAAKAGKSIELIINTKAAGDPTVTLPGSHSAGITFDSSISVPPQAETELRQFANVTTVSTPVVVYAQLKDSTGDAEWVPEGGLKPSMNASIEEKTVNAGKVALLAPITEETMMDMPQLVEEIRSEMIYKIGTAEEEGILNGTGTNGEIKGIYSDLPEYTLTGVKVDSPNRFDAIVAAYTQIVSVSKQNYSPNLVRVHPVDLANMKLTKDKNGQYLFPPFSLQDGTLISGVQIRPSTTIAQETFLLGDFRYLNIRDLMGLRIDFGYTNDNFSKNVITMRGEKRLLAYIKSNYLSAFVKGNYKTIMEAIDANAGAA